MMDLVILGVFAFWLGKNFDGFDLDFSQNQDGELEPNQNQDPARFTEWEERRKQIDPKYPADTYSLWARKYMQIQDGQDIVLFEQYQIRKNGTVFRSGYRDLAEAISQFDEMVRPRTPEEQARFDEIAAAKEAENSQNQEKERPPSQPLFEDYSASKGGVF